MLAFACLVIGRICSTYPLAIRDLDNETRDGHDWDTSAVISLGQAFFFLPGFTSICNPLSYERLWSSFSFMPPNRRCHFVTRRSGISTARSEISKSTPRGYLKYCLIFLQRWSISWFNFFPRIWSRYAGWSGTSLRCYSYSCWFQAYRRLTPGRQRLMFNARPPTPNARHPTPNARAPTPNTQRPAPNAQRPAPDAWRLMLDARKLS